MKMKGKLVMKSNEFYNLLKTHTLQVVFTKLDGSVRNMKCTLQSQYLPEKYRGESQYLEELFTDAVRVWDLDLGEFRSIITDSIQTVTILNDDFVNLTPSVNLLLG